MVDTSSLVPSARLRGGWHLQPRLGEPSLFSIPQWFFRVSDMPAARHPQIFATLGMVISLYGILYLEVARVPERGWMIAAVGLAGKVLGPIGLMYLIVVGVWPPKTLVIAVTNDFIWWPFLTLHLVDAWPAFRGDLGRY